MKRILIIAVSLILAVGVFASNTAMEARNLPYWAGEDEANVLSLPTDVLTQTRMVRLEYLTDDGDYWGGIHYSLLGESLKFAVYFNKPYYGELPNINWETGDTDGTFEDPDYPRSTFDLVLGYDLGGLQLGFLFNFTNACESSYIEDIGRPVAGGDDKYDYERTTREYNFILELAMADFASFKKVRFLVDFGMPSYYYHDRWEVYDGANWDLNYDKETNLDGALYLGFRTIWEMEKMRFFASFRSEKLDAVSDYRYDDEMDGVYEVHNRNSIENRAATMVVGLSRDSVWKNWWFKFGGYFEYYSMRVHSYDTDELNTEIMEGYEFDLREMSVPLFFSAEFHLKKWLVFWVGFNGGAYYYYDMKIFNPGYAGGAVDYEENYEDAGHYIARISARAGVRLQFGNLRFDLVVDPEDFLDNWLLTGDDHTQFTNASLVYFWR
ncbi:hypothetical protein KAU32_06130 [bacterium]|nr:hypothetical protein [bacterium]